MHFTRDATGVVGGDRQGTIHVWDVQSGTESMRHAAHDGPVAVMALSTDGDWLASADEAGNVRVWEMALKAGSAGE